MSRRQQFIVFVVLLGVTAGARELWNLAASRHQSDAVACIEVKGGKLHRQWPENMDYVEVPFIGRQFTDEDVKLLRYFPELRIAAFLDTCVTDDTARAFQEDRPGVQVVVDATPRH